MNRPDSVFLPPIHPLGRRHFLFILFTILLLSIGGYLLYKICRPVSFSPSHFAESSLPLQNPYCGFYQLYGFRLSEAQSTDEIKKTCEQYLSATDRNLILLEINLAEYANQPLTQTALKELSLLLSEFSSAKKQLILRFLYDWDGKALETEPEKREQILSHMKQVSPIINTFAPSIFLLQGTWTGNCGEMTQTNYGSANDLICFMNQLSRLTDPQIFLSVRTPAQLRTITGSFQALAGSQPYDGTLSARLGLFNDGMLGSVFDYGTYDDTPLLALSQSEDISSSPADYSEKGTRKEEILFQDRLCRYVPNGGEVIVDNPCNDLGNAISDLSAMHVSYLNQEHDEAVLNKWKHTSLGTSSQDSAYSGCNGYDYIAAHLGYRYVIRQASLSYSPWKNPAAKLSLTLENTGFAPAYRRFQTTLLLKNKETKEETEISLDFDNRTLLSEASTILSISLPVKELEQGSYELYFSMTDPASTQKILLANEDASESIFLGRLKKN